MSPRQAARPHEGRARTGRLRTALALGSVLVLGIGITTAAFTDEAHVLFTGPAGAAPGIGYADHPAIWLSNGGSGVQAPPAGRDYWMVGNGVAVTSNAAATFVATTHVFPSTGAIYSLDVTPTLSLVPVEGSSTDVAQWLRFTVEFPDTRVLENLTAEEFNNHPDRHFTVCNDKAGAVSLRDCNLQTLRVTVAYDPLTPYRFRDSEVNIRMSFEAVTSNARTERP